MSAPEVFLPLQIAQMGYVQQLHAAALNGPSAAQIHAAQHAVLLLKEQAKRIQKTEKSAAAQKAGKDGDDKDSALAKGKTKISEEPSSAAEESAPTAAHDESPWSGRFVDRSV